MGEVKVRSGFTLPDEKIIVKYIHRNSGMAANVEKDHVISGGMLNTSFKRFSAPLQRNGAIKNVLNEEEKSYLESMTGLNLSVYGDYWSNAYVKLGKEDASNILDLKNPEDYISYKILLSLTKEDIAPSWADRNLKQTYQFALTKEDEELIESKTKFNIKKEAYKFYGKIEDDKVQVLGILRLMTNKLISEDSSLEWLQGKLGELVENKPTEFLNVIKDKSLPTKLMVNEAIEKDVIVKKGNKYSTVDGLDLCNSGEIPTFENAVAYLDNPKNQEVRDIIEAKINKK
jgi:hypothetical protein